MALPDAFAVDGQIETFLTVLEEFGAYPAVIQRELDRYLPFLATTKVLIAAVRAGMGREAAHEVIKEHAVAVALAMRSGAPNRTCWIASPRSAASAGPGGARRGAGRQGGVHRFGRRPGGRGRRRGERVGERLSGRRQVHARRDPLKSMSLKDIDFTDLDNFADGFRTTSSRSTAGMRRSTGTSRPRTPRRRGFLVGGHPPGNPCRASRCGHLFVGDRRWSPYGGTLLQDLPIAGQVLNMMDDPRHTHIRRLVSSGLTRG